MALTLVTCLVPASAAYADDGTNTEVGVWWIGDYRGQDLDYADDSALGLKNKLVNYGWTAVHDIGDGSVYEIQFKRVGLGNGADASYTDAVDLAYYVGHATPISNIWALVMADTTHDDQLVQYSDCQWGDIDLEWMMFDSCQLLNDTCDNYWAGTMNGLHLICGAVTYMYIYNNGGCVADLLIDDGWWDWARTVKNSWFSGCDENQPDGRILRVIGETDTCGDDYIWGQGSVCADPTHDGYFTLWTYYC